MTPPLLIGAGLFAVALGALVLRTFGTGYRIGRLLSAAPLVTVADAAAIAAAGRARYVRVEGRIDATDEFVDDAGRPLVHRRVRFDVREGGRWRTVVDERRTVPFSLNEGLESIGVAGETLDEGLVVISRESAGVVADAPDALPDGLDPALPVRMRVEQVSSVDHAIACGVPALDADGRAVLGPGLGRPLVLTILGRDDAMRILAGGSRVRPLLATLALGVGLVLVLAGLGLGLAGVLLPPPASAAASSPAPVPTPSPTAAPSSPAPSSDAAASSDEAPLAGDTRSSGSGPGFVGEPVLAVGGVLAIGLAAVGLTLLYVRLTGGVP